MAELPAFNRFKAPDPNSEPKAYLTINGEKPLNGKEFWEFLINLAVDDTGEEEEFNLEEELQALRNLR